MDNDIIKQWLSHKDKPLFIRGAGLSGKTTLAHELLKDYHIVHVNSDHCKHNSLIEYVTDGLNKKDILMMCSKDKSYKALLLDDLQVFLMYGKPNVKLLYSYIKGVNTSKTPVIIVCNEMVHKYTALFENICYNVSMDTPPISNNDSDTLYTVQETLDLLFKEEEGLTCTDTFRLCSPGYTVLSLNMLENSPSIIKKDNYIHCLYDICESMCIADNMESKYIDKVIHIDTHVYFNCIRPYHFIKRELSISKDYVCRYNSYIGKSLIQIHNQKYLQSDTYIILLKQLYEDGLNDDITMTTRDIQILEKYIKVFNYYYHTRLTKKWLHSVLKI